MEVDAIAGCVVGLGVGCVVVVVVIIGSSRIGHVARSVGPVVFGLVNLVSKVVGVGAIEGGGWAIVITKIDAESA